MRRSPIGAYFVAVVCFLLFVNSMMSACEHHRLMQCGSPTQAD